MHLKAAALLASLVCCFASLARAEDTIRGQEHFIENAGIRLRIWEKCQGAPDGKPIVILAHGSATAGEESFDLRVADVPATSLMEFLAREGFDVFAPDIRGFGRSTHPANGVSTEEARDDFLNVITYAKTIRGAGRVNVVAWSWATQYAGLAVIAHPELVARYVAYAQMHAGSPDLIKRRERLAEFRSAPYLQLAEATWKKRFFSATPPEANDSRIVEAFAKAAAGVELQTPTGPQIDLVTRLPFVDPAKLTVPTLMIQGQYDDVATDDGLRPFFEAITATDKSYLTIPAAGHMAHLQAGRGHLQAAIAQFLKR